MSAGEPYQCCLGVHDSRVLASQVNTEGSKGAITPLHTAQSGLSSLMALLLALLPLATALSPIHVEDGHFVDEFGRVRLFHGINSVIKEFPWYDPKMRDPARHRQLAEWGFTAVSKTSALEALPLSPPLGEVGSHVDGPGARGRSHQRDVCGHSAGDSGWSGQPGDLHIPGHAPGTWSIISEVTWLLRMC